VVVVRDPARHAWQAQVLAAVRGHEESVVVDVGWATDVTLVDGRQPTVRTRGVAPVLLAAAARRLADAGR
jgi:hypothetical protein